MDRVIAVDSSANLLTLPGVRFASVPQKIVTDEAEYTDDGVLDVDAMVAALAGVLGIRVVGAASRAGTLELLHKCRGRKAALDALLRCMRERGYAGGSVRIAHCQDRDEAELLRFTLLDAWPEADVQILPTRGLCSFYAESGGLMLGFEG